MTQTESESAPESILTSPSSSTEATSSDWRSTLDIPDEVKSWQGLNNIKNVSDAVTQLYNAQKLVGVEKLPAPKKEWKEKEWNDFYNRLGRPETPDKYALPEFSEEESKYVSKDDMKGMLTKLHKLGLTQSQAEAYIRDTVSEHIQATKTYQQQAMKAGKEGLIQLKQEWGDSFDANVDLAKQAIKKFEGKEVASLLARSGLDLHPSVLKFFSRIGATATESSVMGRPSGDVNSPGYAKVTLDQLRRDSEWTKALHDHNHPRHEAVVKERFELLQKMVP